MKVLRWPPTVENWSTKQYCTGFRHTGKGCGARLKVYREDLRCRLGTPEKEVSVTFKCIHCGMLTDIGIMYYPTSYKELKPYKQSWIDQDNDISCT